MIGYYLVRRGLFFRKLYLHKDGGGKWTSKIKDAYYFTDKQTVEMAGVICGRNCRLGMVSDLDRWKDHINGPAKMAREKIGT